MISLGCGFSRVELKRLSKIYSKDGGVNENKDRGFTSDQVLEGCVDA